MIAARDARFPSSANGPNADESSASRRVKQRHCHLVLCQAGTKNVPDEYRQLCYPSDYAGVCNGRVVDDGNLLSFQPSPWFSRRILPLCFLLGFFGFVGAWFIIDHHRNWVQVALTLSVFSCLCVLCIFGFIVDTKRKGMTPWITVDQKARLIRLPRPKRHIRFESTVRLQLVSFKNVGVASDGLSFRGTPPSGELQIVFNDGGKEQTYCLVYYPDPCAVKSFAVKFRQATGIPVSRVYPTTSGEWHVEPLDATLDDRAESTKIR